MSAIAVSQSGLLFVSCAESSLFCSLRRHMWREFARSGQSYLCYPRYKWLNMPVLITRTSHLGYGNSWHLGNVTCYSFPDFNDLTYLKNYTMFIVRPCIRKFTIHHPSIFHSVVGYLECPPPLNFRNITKNGVKLKSLTRYPFGGDGWQSILFGQFKSWYPISVQLLPYWRLIIHTLC